MDLHARSQMLLEGLRQNLSTYLMDGLGMIDVASQEVELRAQRALASSPIYALREVRVEKRKDGLLLLGHVDTFYHKQLAQELVRTVCKDMKVLNEINVDYGSKLSDPD